MFANHGPQIHEKAQLAYRQEFHIFWGVKAKEHTIMHIENDKNQRHLAERN